MLNLTSENFNETIKSNPIVLVEFWAEWCGPCKQLNPILEDIDAENDILVAKVNVDEQSALSNKYGISSIPTMIVFENGLPAHNIIGAMPKHKLEKELDGWI
jgi:thioredoxin 1